MLKVEGKCAIVLPDGQDLFNKSNTTLVSIREYLMKKTQNKYTNEIAALKVDVKIQGVVRHEAFPLSSRMLSSILILCTS